ncbi:MAG: hypothetical protein ACLQLG_13120 [Thermoguttaceae bacterium]
MREIVVFEENNDHRVRQMVAIVFAQELEGSQLCDEDVRRTVNDVLDTAAAMIGKGIAAAFGGNPERESEGERRLRGMKPGLKDLFSRGVFVEDREISDGKMLVVDRYTLRWPPRENQPGGNKGVRNR